MSTWFWITITLVCSLQLQTAKSSNAQYGDVRLFDGTTVNDSAKGRLEIYLNGYWGTVCDDGFESIEADVACRQLGFERALYFGSTDQNSPWGLQFSNDETLPIMLDDLWCEDTDNSLLDCSHAGIGNHNCHHYEDVQLVCLTDGSLRLVNHYETSYGFSREAPTSGLLEIYMQGQWGTICNNNFDDTAANIACKSLGFTGMYYHEVAIFIGLPSGNDGSPIWLDNVSCSPEDLSLLSCEHNPVGVHNCSHWQDVGLMCYNSGFEWDGGALGIVLTIVFGFGGCLSTIIGVCVCVGIGFMCAKHQSANQARRNGPMVVNTANQGTTAPAYPVQTYPAHSTSQHGYPPPTYQQTTQSGYPTQFNMIPPLPHSTLQGSHGPPLTTTYNYPENQNTQSQQATGCPYQVEQAGFQYPTQNNN